MYLSISERVSQKTTKFKIVESEKLFVDIWRFWATKKNFRSLASSDLSDQDTYILREMVKIRDIPPIFTDICIIHESFIFLSLSCFLWTFQATDNTQKISLIYLFSFYQTKTPQFLVKSYDIRQIG